MTGGIPTILPDVPVDAVFIFLFAILAPSHMALFLRNKSQGRLFVFNAMTFGFGMSRIAACSLRLAWAVHPTNANLELAAQIFLNAGILLVYIINNLFLMRLIRSAMPNLGWHRVFRPAYKAYLWLCVPMIIMLITIIILSVKRPTAEIIYTQDVIRKLGQTFFLAVAAFPLLWLPFLMFWPESRGHEPFGKGHLRVKASFLLLTTCLGVIEAGFRCGTTWEPSRPITNPAWYDSKAAFYCFNFMIDVLVMIAYLVARIDLLFFVPSKSNGPGDYSREFQPKSSAASIDEDEKQAA